MTQHAWLVGLLLGGCAATGHPILAGPLIATAQDAAQHCIDLDSETLHALQRGDRRLVVVVKAIELASPPSASLVAALIVGGESPQRQVLDQFAVHPLRAISAEDPGRQQRFLLSLAQHRDLIDDFRPLCLEIGFDSRQGVLRGGRVELEIELSEPLPK